MAIGVGNMPEKIVRTVFTKVLHIGNVFFENLDNALVDKGKLIWTVIRYFEDDSLLSSIRKFNYIERENFFLNLFGAANFDNDFKERVKYLILQGNREECAAVVDDLTSQYAKMSLVWLSWQKKFTTCGIKGEIDEAFVVLVYNIVSRFMLDGKNSDFALDEYEVSRILGLLIKHFADYPSRNPNVSCEDYCANHWAIIELGQIFSDNGAIELEDGAVFDKKHYAALLEFILYGDNESFLHGETCEALLECAIENGIADIASKKEMEAARLKSENPGGADYKINSLFNAGEQKFINMLEACFNERSGEVKQLPSCSIYDFLDDLMLMSPKIYDDKTKKRIKTEFTAGVTELIGKPSVLWAIAEEERNICLTAQAINEKCSKIRVSSEVYEVAISCENGEHQTSEGEKLVVSLSKDEYEEISRHISELKCAWDNLLDGYNQDDWEVVYPEVSSRIEELRAFFRAKGINSELFAPKVRVKK